jgi:F-type H+-transporting ATPase subunit b
MKNRLGIRNMRHIIKTGFFSLGLLLTDIQLVLAEPASHGYDDHHEASSGGLPQLDPSTYPSQIFWLIVAFILLYMFFSSKTLPEMSTVMENRKDRISNDLNTAEQLKNDIEAAQKNYEASLTGARDKAAKTLADTNAKIAEKAAKENDAFRETADKEIAALEKEITKAKKDAMNDMNAIVAEVSQEAAEKIVGLKLDIKKAQTVVKALNQKKAA